MDILAQILEINLELNADKQHLKELGLTEDDIEGYVEFFIGNYFDDIEPIGEVH